MNDWNWKGELMQLLTFTVAPLLGALGVVWAVRARAVAEMDAARFAKWALGLFLVTRVGTHLVVFHLFRYAGTNDLLNFWEPMARDVLAGRDPSAHTDTMSGPLFPFVMAIGYALSGGRYAPGIDLPFVVADGVALWLLLRIARRRLPETTARRIVLATLLSPLLWIGVTVCTQDEALFACLLLATLDLADRGYGVAAAAVAAVGTLATKSLFPPWVLPVLVASSVSMFDAVRRYLLSLLFTAAGFAVAVGLGWSIASRAQSSRGAFGSSTWFLFVPDGNISADAFRLGLAATGTTALFLSMAAIRRRDGESVTDAAVRGVVVAQAVFFVLCPYTIPFHLVHALPFLVWQLVREGADARPIGAAAAVLLLGFAAWQVPSIRFGAEAWSGAPLASAAFAAFWGWTGWRALTARWTPLPAVAVA
jgi:hypothetical protein